MIKGYKWYLWFPFYGMFKYQPYEDKNPMNVARWFFIYHFIVLIIGSILLFRTI